MKLPSGYTPVSLEQMLYHFREIAPGLGKSLFEHLEMPETEAAERIVELEHKGLVQFAVGPDDVPAGFIAGPDQFAADGVDRAFADKLVSYWDVQGTFDGDKGRFTSVDVDFSEFVQRVWTPEGYVGVITPLAKKLLTLNLLTVKQGQLTGPSKAQVTQWVEEHGICDFCSDPNPKHTEDVADFAFPGVQYTSQGGWATCDTCHLLVLTNRRKDLLQRGIAASHGGSSNPLTTAALKELHKRFWEMVDARKRPPLPPMVLPHWQQALDRKVDALREISIFEKLSSDDPRFHGRFQEISWMGFDEDIRALRVADVYSFNAETMYAIMEGAKSIPHESPLSSIEVPKSLAGWFWFAEPFPAAPSPLASDTTAALLWLWDTVADKPALRFSAYVVDDKASIKKGHILPSAKWLWPLDFSFHDMIGLNRQLHQNAYGPDGPFAGRENLVGEDVTIKVVADLSLFFMMACLWFRQTVPGTKKKMDPVLTQTPGHIERHARKRYEKEFKTTPTVHVIALRKSAKVEDPEAKSSEVTRHLHVRFVVKGHPRLQPCGPGRVDRKLIWISPFTKGPDDAPFKGPDDKVFAVIR